MVDNMCILPLASKENVEQEAFNTRIWKAVRTNVYLIEKEFLAIDLYIPF